MRTSEFDSDRTWKIELSSPAEIMANCHLIHTGLLRFTVELPPIQIFNVEIFYEKKF